MANAFLIFSIIFAGITQIKTDTLYERSNADEALLNWTVPEDFKTKFPCHLMGYDYENRPVLLLEWAKWKLSDVTRAGGKPLEDLEKMQDQFVERLRTSFFERPTNKTEGTNEDEFVLLMDLDRYDYTQVLLPSHTKYLIKYFTRLNDAYGKFAYGILLNVSSVGENFVNMFKLVAGKYIDSSELNGTNQRIWKPRLLKKIPKNQLLPKYGGNEGYKSLAHCVKYSNPN